jgi:hypothetical protein
LSAVKAHELAGAYELLRFEIRYSDGRSPTHPFGADARGQLLYARCGVMSAMLSRADREPLAVDRLEAYAEASEARKAAAFDSFLSYGGRWTLAGDTVTHHVQLATVPELVGRSQTRSISLSGEVLTLSYEIEARSGVSRRYALDWRRVAG